MRLDHKTNNFWQATRLRRVKDFANVERALERGITPVTLEEASKVSSHLPRIPDEMLAVDPDERAPTLPLFNGPETDHPLYKDRPAHLFGEQSSWPRGDQLDFAKSMFNAVEIRSGLPDRITSAVPDSEVIGGQEDIVSNLVREAWMFDSTQKVLPKQIAVPNIGWHPVVDRMFRSMPYDVESAPSWGRKVRRDYGIPKIRQINNLLGGLLQHCDYLVSAGHPELTSRHQIEGCAIRQFFEKDDRLVRFVLDFPFVVTDSAPLPPFASASEVGATREAPLPDLFPMNAFAGLHPKHVYRHENNFPVADPTGHPAPHTVLGFGRERWQYPWWGHDYYASRSLAQSFMLALGQARLLYGDEEVAKMGELERPIAVQFVYTNGQRYFFSAFQLNTLDLNSGSSGVRNIFWQMEKPLDLFKTCDFVQGRPQLEGFDPQVFRVLQAMYMQKTEKVPATDAVESETTAAR